MLQHGQKQVNSSTKNFERPARFGCLSLISLSTSGKVPNRLGPDDQRALAGSVLVTCILAFVNARLNSDCRIIGPFC